jgi:hypothetical protein|nr:MAG TPA: protein of unknown function (DUF5432) [Caudoviricetes sp.]
MKFNEKELEYLITYAEQLKILTPRITYNDQLIKDLFINMKLKTPVNNKNLSHIVNNFIVMDLIGFNTYDKKLRQTIEDYFNDLN